MSTPSICSTAGSAITGTTSTGGGAAGSVTTPRKITATNGSSSSSSSSNKKARTSKESNSNASGCAAGEAAASVSSGGEKSAKQRAKVRNTLLFSYSACTRELHMQYVLCASACMYLFLQCIPPNPLILFLCAE